MKPRLTTFTRSPRAAARFILNNDTAAFPTETVYGLGANVFSEEALKKIFLAKGRPSDNPLIVHICDITQIELLSSRVPRSARTIIAEFFPGPITVIVPKRPEISPLVSAGLPTIGVRMPRHETAQKFLKACGVPVAAPSANLSGRPSPTSWQSVRDDLEGRIGCILMGAKTDVGLESTVVDCTGRRPIVLRTGAVTLEALKKVIPETTLYKKKPATGILPGEHEAVKSPGMKYRHYSPEARVRICTGRHSVTLHAEDLPAAYIGMHEPAKSERFAMLRLCTSLEEYARTVFSFFRHCDRKQMRTICCEEVPHEGIGRALMDRIGRAAHHEGTESP